MAQGRILNKSISTDPEFNGMSSQAQLLYLKTIPHLDRDGLIIGHLSRLWAMIDPFHAEVLSRMGEYVQEWLDAGLVIRYDTGRELVLFFKGFRKNNANIRYEEEAPSVFPPPPGWLRTAAGLVPEDEDLRRHLAQKFDPKSSYRAALLQLSNDSASTRELVDSDSQPSRLQYKTIQYKHDDVVVQTNKASSLGNGIEGGVGGDSPLDDYANELDEVDEKTMPDHLAQFGDATLGAAALQLGHLVFGGQHWVGYENFLLTAKPATLMVLLEWLFYFHEQPYDAICHIKSLPALVRSRLQKRERPILTSKERQALIKLVAQIQLEAY